MAACIHNCKEFYKVATQFLPFIIYCSYVAIYIYMSYSAENITS